MINLSKKLKEVLDCVDISDKPNLFLHVCCCPCSSHIILKLIKYFNIYIVFYNPNIDTYEEFSKRLNELKRFIDLIKIEYNLPDIPIIYDDYNHDEFLNHVKGYEFALEGGDRCERCIELRLEETLKIVRKYLLNNEKNEIIQNKTSFFCTSLSTSPHKNASLIYNLGNKLCENTNILYLPSDFKKEDGFLDSIKLSKKYNIYRQNYCGCEFSKQMLNN